MGGSRRLQDERPAPDLRVIMRAEPAAPIEVLDILRPAALRIFAHAG